MAPIWKTGWQQPARRWLGHASRSQPALADNNIYYYLYSKWSPCLLPERHFLARKQAGMAPKINTFQVTLLQTGYFNDPNTFCKIALPLPTGS